MIFDLRNLQSPVLKTPIPNSNYQLVILSPICDFHFQVSNGNQEQTQNKDKQTVLVIAHQCSNPISLIASQEAYFSHKENIHRKRFAMFHTRKTFIRKALLCFTQGKHSSEKLCCFSPWEGLLGFLCSRRGRGSLMNQTGQAPFITDPPRTSFETLQEKKEEKKKRKNVTRHIVQCGFGGGCCEAVSTR